MTFGEYLRAVVTADADLVPDDDLGYRIAFIEGFRRRGIYPSDVRTLSADSLRWQGPTLELAKLDHMLRHLDTAWDLRADRRRTFELSNKNCAIVHSWLMGAIHPADETQMGITLQPLKEGETPLRVEIHSVRPVRRVGPDGQLLTDLVIEITQRRKEPIDPENPDLGTTWFRGGCTLLIDRKSATVRYCVSKNILSQGRLARQRRFLVNPRDLSLYATYFGTMGTEEPFALLHRGF